MNMDILQSLPARLLFIIAMPLLFISISVRIMSTNEWFYARGFDTYGVTSTTGLDRSELVKGAKGLIAYWSSPEDRISVQVNKDGKMIPLFNDREVAHLKDVKDLFQLASRIGELSGLYLIAYTLLLIARPRRGDGRRLASLIFQGSLLTLGLLALVAIGSLVDFESLFIKFHEIFFRNDFWILDPSKDYLIMMFPEGFWMDVALAIGAIVAVQGLIAGGASYVYLRKRQRNVAPGIGVAPH